MSLSLNTKITYSLVVNNPQDDLIELFLLHYFFFNLAFLQYIKTIIPWVNCSQN